MVKYGLVIGINYIGTSSQLYGCINDAEDIRDLLIREEFKDGDIVVLRDDRTDLMPTGQRIVDELRRLTSVCQEGDCVWISYSGHGGQTRDRSGDEEDGKDETIYPCDYFKCGAIVDDDLKAIISEFRDGVKVTIVIDACHSGSMLDLRYNYRVNPKTRRDVEMQISELAGFKDRNIVMLSGCLDSQYSADAYFKRRANGALTRALLDLLYLCDDLSIRDLLVLMNKDLQANQFAQIPQFSADSQIALTRKFISRLRLWEDYY